MVCQTTCLASLSGDTNSSSALGANIGWKKRKAAIICRARAATSSATGVAASTEIVHVAMTKGKDRKERMKTETETETNMKGMNTNCIIMKTAYL